MLSYVRIHMKKNVQFYTSVISCGNKTIFAGQVSAFQGRLHTRFEVYRVSHYHASLQKLTYSVSSIFLFSSFLHNSKNSHKTKISNPSTFKLGTNYKNKVYHGTKFGSDTRKLTEL